MRWLRILFSVLIAGIVVGGPYFYAQYRKTHFRNFHVVSAGVLYRSGQMSLDGLKRMIYDHDIRSVVTLRFAATPGEAPPDHEEESYCKSASLNYYRIPYRPWLTDDGSVPAEIGLKKFLNIMSDPSNYPVLIHCFAGIHRTGAFCAVYRMEFENWSNAQAIQEMKNLGYVDDHRDVLTYLEHFHPFGIIPPSSLQPAIRPASHQP